MGAYKEKVDLTKKGLDELDESTRHATIERLLAGIQYKKTKPEEILKLTEHFRNRHNMEDSELYRLGEFAEDYNDLYATKNNKCFGTTEILLNKRQSQYKSWREIVKTTTPRYKPAPRDKEDPRSIYEASFLTYRPYEKDIWGPASYGTLVTDLWKEIEIIIDHMEDGKRLCKDVMDKEEIINQDPEWKEQLFWNQYNTLAEKNQSIIEDHCKKGIVNTDNPVYKKMLTYPNINAYAQNHFHDPSEMQFSEFVTNHSVLTLQGNDISAKERILWGTDFNKIKLVRFAIEHADNLLSSNGKKFDPMDTLYFIKWCHVNKSIRRHKDNEHVLYDYIKTHYQGHTDFHGWPNLFGLRKQFGNSEEVWKTAIEVFEKKIQELYKSHFEDNQTPEK